jgi:hypothetical protein
VVYGDSTERRRRKHGCDGTAQAPESDE